MLPAQLVSFADVALEYLREGHIDRVAVIGARPVADLGRWSHYRRLVGQVDIELLNQAQAAQVHQLIYDVKAFGADHPGIGARFSKIIDSLESHAILLACTELPLIPVESAGKQLVDVTELVAHKLAALANQESGFQGDRCARPKAA